MQHAKKKGYRQYLDGFQEVLKKATALVRDEKIAPKVTRIFNVWNERSIYPDEFISDLRQVLADKTDIGRESYAQNRVPTDFSLNSLERKIKENDVMEKTSKVLLAALNTNKIDKIDSHLVLKLKDKKAGERCCKELADIENQLKAAVMALERQAHCRTSLVDTLEKCELFYETQNEEVKIVANAYRNFAARVKGVRSKLSSNSTTFPSPYPSPVLDAPSPNSDDDLVLPANSSPLPGLKSLLNVFNEERTNKVSSLDKRLSNLMQNLPINQLQMPKDEHQDRSASQANKATPSQPHQVAANPQQSSAGHPMNQFSPLNSQPPIVASVNVPPPPIPPPGIPPPFVPQAVVSPSNPMAARGGQNYYYPQQPPPRLPPTANHQTQESSSDYYSSNQHGYDHHHSQSKSSNQPPFAGHHSTNSGYGDTSNSVQQIRSVISTRNAQQPGGQPPELNDSGRLPYDPYASMTGLNNTMDSFEPTDMDLGNSDDEEMNRSTNSTRVLKVIETSDDSNYSGGHLNSSFNKKHSLTSAYGSNSSSNFPHQPMNPHHHSNHSNHSNQSVSLPPATINLTPHVPPPSLNIPPSLPHHIPAKPNSSFNLSSGSLNTSNVSASSNLSTSLNSSSGSSGPKTSSLSNLNTSSGSLSGQQFAAGNPHHHSNYHNGKHATNSKPYSTPGKSFHHNDRSPRWSNNNHPLTGGPTHKPASSNNHQYGGNQPPFSSSNQYGSSNAQQSFASGNSNQSSFGSTGSNHQQPFGSGSSSQQPPPFGSASSNKQQTSFGSGSNNQPFGASTSSQPSSFGSSTSNQPSSFGSGNSNQQPPPFGPTNSNHQQSFGSGSSNHQQAPFSSSGGGQFVRSNSFNNNNRTPWKAQHANKNYHNPHQNRNRSFSNSNFASSGGNFSNNSSFSGGNFGYPNKPGPVASNLTNLTHPPPQYP